MTTLSPADDELLHIGPSPVGADGPRSCDQRFFERYWNVLHDDTGDLLLAVGGSFYPHLGRAESYAIANSRGDHRSVRAFRPLGADLTDRTDLAVGPLRPTVLSGLRRWRHVLEPGEWGFCYDFTVTDTHRHVYNAAWGPEVEHGERHVTAGFEGFCTVEGWVRHGETLVEWGPGRTNGAAHGTRDRHWGVGRGVGGPSMNGGRAVRGGWKGGIWIDLGDVAVWGKQVLYPLGDPRPGSARPESGRVVDVRRRLRFEPDTRVFTEGLVDLTMDDGRIRRLYLERLGDQTAYMRCGFYGGTPEAGLHHGEYTGPARVEWDRFDVTSATARLALRGLDEHHCRVVEDGRETTGILQPLEPDAYEACVAGARGWELL